MALTSCKTASNVSKKPLYYEQYLAGEISYMDYKDLCVGENELHNMERLYQKGIRQNNRDKRLTAFGFINN